jgi:hypothetical protein
MSVRFKIIITILTLFLCSGKLSSQLASFNGEAAGWLNMNYSGGFGFQTGLRYIPQLQLNKPLKDKNKFDGEISADSYLSYNNFPDSAGYFDKHINFYRFWLRFSGDRFEMRAGLQKINFGSASMLRPLMWFDRIDPRDPLQITKGVYGVLGKYYFSNNANIWLWTLYGNSETKGWEQIPSKSDRPEFGGRVQLPVPRGEIALTYHNRVGQFPADHQPPVTGSMNFPENRIGLDFKLDLGIGIWYEGTITHQDHPDLLPYTKAMTIGADYTFNIGEGLNISAENLWYNSSDEFIGGGDPSSFTALSLSMPLSIITRVSAIVFYDWKNEGWYRYGNISFTFDKLSVNLIGFWNPESFRLFNYTEGANMFSGAGGQVMVVYNH